MMLLRYNNLNKINVNKIISRSIFNYKDPISIIRNLFVKTCSKPLPLGRWKVETCNIKLNNKVDLSNEDHCGPCGEYGIINKNSINLLENEDKLKK